MIDLLAAVTQRPFNSEEQIREFVRDKIDDRIRTLYETAKNRPNTPLSNFRAIQIFATDAQQSWLVADNADVHFVVDDRRWEMTRWQWSMRLGDALKMKVDQSWSETAGAIQFGNRSDYVLYSKALFSREPITTVISRFLLPDR